MLLKFIHLEACGPSTLGAQLGSSYPNTILTAIRFILLANNNKISLIIFKTIKNVVKISLRPIHFSKAFTKLNISAKTLITTTRIIFYVLNTYKILVFNTLSNCYLVDKKRLPKIRLNIIVSKYTFLSSINFISLLVG